MMEVTCKCGNVFEETQIPCPESHPLCGVAHFDDTSFVCPACGYNSGPDITANIREGRVTVLPGLSIINTQAIIELERVLTMENMEFSVLGLFGPAGSGKDLTADWFVEKQGYTKVAFADPMKRFVLRTFPGISPEVLWGDSELRNQEFDISEMWWFTAIGSFGSGSTEIAQEVLNDGNRVDGYLKLHTWLTELRKSYPNKISARIILQTLGTEWGRTVDPMMWANYAYRVAAKIRDGAAYTQQEGIALTGIPVEDRSAGVIIPDHRFLNEVENTQEHDGYVLRLRRLSLEEGQTNVGIQGHVSELEGRTIPDSAFDLVLNFEEGVDSVYRALEQVTKEKAWRIKRASK